MKFSKRGLLLKEKKFAPKGENYLLSELNPVEMGCKEENYRVTALKAPIRTAADDIHTYFFIVFFSEKISLDVSTESFAWQRIHLKHQALFSSKDKSKKLKCRLLQFLFGALRVNTAAFPESLSIHLYFPETIYRKNSKYWDIYV